MQTDIIYWISVILIPITIASLVWLIIYTFRKPTGPNSADVSNTGSTKKLYRLRFVVGIAAPLVVLVIVFYLSCIILGGIYGDLWLFSGGAVYALNVAIIGVSAILFAFFYASIRQINSDLLSTPYQTDSIIRSSKKILYLTRAYAVILILPLAYVSFQYAYTVLTDSTNSQQFCRTAEKVSYTNKDKMVSDFLAALNASDVEKATGFYYRGQWGSVVIPQIEDYIQTKNNSNIEYAQYDFPSWSPCRADSSGNNSCAVEIGGIGVGSMIQEAKTNHWYILAGENYAENDVCKN